MFILPLHYFQNWKPVMVDFFLTWKNNLLKDFLLMQLLSSLCYSDTCKSWYIYILRLLGEIPSKSHDVVQLEATRVFFCYGENNSQEGFLEKEGREGGNMREQRMREIIPKRIFKHWISWLIDFHFIALLLRTTLCKIVSERRELIFCILNLQI